MDELKPPLRNKYYINESHIFLSPFCPLLVSFTVSYYILVIPLFLLICIIPSLNLFKPYVSVIAISTQYIYIINNAQLYKLCYCRHTAILKDSNRCYVSTKTYMYIYNSTLFCHVYIIFHKSTFFLHFLSFFTFFYLIFYMDR
jgi:hypothetical protein